MSGSGSANKRSVDGEMKRQGRHSPMETDPPPGGEWDTSESKAGNRRQRAESNGVGAREITNSNGGGDHGNGNGSGGAPVVSKKGRPKSSMKNGQSSSSSQHHPPNGVDEGASSSIDGGKGQRGQTLNQAANSSSSAASSPATAAEPLPIQPPAPLSITSEEVNFLLYRYLQECGFVHSAFSFAHESGCGRVRPRNSGSVPPGALVMFLQKGLQYVGMEESLMRDLKGDSAAAGEGEPAAKRTKAGGSDEPNADGGEPSESMGPDFSLLCPRSLHTLTRKDPPIKLRVPPASAAAATKAMIEMEEKLTRERRSGEEKRRKAIVEKEKEKEKLTVGVKNQSVELKASKAKAEPMEQEVTAVQPPAAKPKQQQAAAAAETTPAAPALPTPKKKKKKKKGANKAAAVEEEAAPPAPKEKEGKKKNNNMEVDEVKPTSSKGKKASQQQQQQAAAQAKAAASNTTATTSMGQIEATAAAMRAAAAGQMFPPGMAAAVSQLVKHQKGNPAIPGAGGATQPNALSRDGTPLLQQQQQQQQQGFPNQKQQQAAVQQHQRQQQEYQMEMAAAKRMQDAQRFQEAQRMQQEAQAHHQHRMHQEMVWNAAQQQQQQAGNMPQTSLQSAQSQSSVDPRGPPQSYQSQMDPSAQGNNVPTQHQSSEAAEVARQRAEIQAVLAQRQQAVQAMAQQQQQGQGPQQGMGQQLPQQSPGMGPQPQQQRKLSGGSQEDTARANAIAALMSAAAQGQQQGAQGQQPRINSQGNADSSLPQGIPSSSSMGNQLGNNAMGNPALHQGQNGQAQGMPVPGDKRLNAQGQQQQRPAEGNAQALAPAAANQQSAASIEEEDRLTAIQPQEVMELSQHTSEVFMCAWNPRFTNLIATGSGDASARIWAINGPDASGGCQQSILLPHGHDSTDKKNKDVTTLEWSSNGELLATGSYDGVARVWSRNGELRQTLKGHRGPIFSLKWNKRGNYLLSGSYDKSTIVWDVTGEVGFVKQQFSYHFAPALDVDWKDDLTFASCSTDKTVQICRVGLARPIKTYTGHADEVNAVKWDPSGTLLASCSDDCTAKVWDINSPRNEPKWDFKSHQQEIYTVKWSPTGPGSKNPNKLLMLATASFDGSVRLWNINNGSCLRILSRHRESVYSVAFSPSGEYLASGSLAGQLYIWNVCDGVHIKSFKGKGDIFEVAWNIEESRVAACFSSNVVSVIDFKKPL